MLQICSRLSFNFAQVKKYVIIKSNYLIEAPPKKPPNVFMAYATEQREGKKGSVTQLSSKLAESWKNLSNEHKSTYENKYKEQLSSYIKELSSYEQKFITPFKRTSYASLYLSQLYKNKLINYGKGINIIQGSNQVAEKFKELPKELKQKLQRESEQIKANRISLKEQFKFPERLYHSQQAYSRANPNIDVKQRAKAYKLYVERWYKEVAKWLKSNNIELDISQFKRMYNRDRKEKTSRKQKDLELIEKSKKELNVTEETKKVASASKK